MNQINLIGRLTADPELRYTPNGTPVVTFRLAVRRNRKNQNGEYETDFIDCVAWQKSAEIIANNMNKGNMFGVSGRLQVREYEYEGQRRRAYEVVVEDFTFVEKKQENGNGYAQQPAQPPQAAQANNSYTPSPSMDYAGYEMDPGDVPF